MAKIRDSAGRRMAMISHSKKCKNTERGGLGKHCTGYPKPKAKRREWYPPEELLVPAGAPPVTDEVIRAKIIEHKMGPEPKGKAAKKAWWKRLWNFLFGGNQ